MGREDTRGSSSSSFLPVSGKTRLWEGFPQHAHKCKLLVLFLKASLTSSPRVTIHGTEGAERAARITPGGSEPCGKWEIHKEGECGRMSDTGVGECMHLIRKFGIWES